ncbi:MAG: 5'/3'-nucleotidase SurE [Lachnospiraceae bacterium]|nr:5'/3'-nucleotidase SurE [Lachnospiraceae bacterium]
MNILLVNDDGIDSPNLVLLAEMTKPFGRVTVVAPETQCSAMSQHITVKGGLTLREAAFPVAETKAFTVSGTPADCVKVGLRFCMEEKPDYIFSGINMGINTGFDICYSGTAAAALEGAMAGIPSIAWSTVLNGDMGATKQFFPEICKTLLERKPKRGHIWNVNFPGIPAGECRGVLYDRYPAPVAHYGDDYIPEKRADGSLFLDTVPQMNRTAEEGTDLAAVMDGYVSVGDYFNAVICYREHQGIEGR